MTLLGAFLEIREKGGPKHSRGGGSKGSKRERLPNAPASLIDHGISRKESSMSQKLSRMAKEEPQKHAAIRNGTPV
jgi:hypothetical protein